MTTKYITYGKKRNRNKLENELVCANFIVILVVWQLTVPGFTHLVVQQKIIKDVVYTPIVDYPTINGILYAHFGGSPKLEL